MLAAVLWLAATAAIFPLIGRLGIDSRRAVLPIYLWSFAGLILGIALAARLFQRRPPRTLIGPGGLRPRAFGLGVAAIAGVSLLALPPVLWLAPPVRQATLGGWAAWLPLALPAVLVQTAAEEIAFRGWLMQGLAARFRSRAVWWLVPALLFGLLHWDPGSFGDEAWIAVVSATAMGLVLADVTIRTGNLSAAMGLHFANNAVALLVVAMPSPLSALALWVMVPEPGLGAPKRLLLLLDLATTLAAYGLWLAACAGRRRLHSRGAGSI